MGEQNVILDNGDESNGSADIWSRLSRVPLPDTNSLDDIHIWIERIESSLAALRPPESRASLSSPCQIHRSTIRVGFANLAHMGA